MSNPKKTSPHAKQVKGLSHPFVTTVATVAALATLPGCLGQVIGGEPPEQKAKLIDNPPCGLIRNPPSALECNPPPEEPCTLSDLGCECPDILPENGAACPEVGKVCSYAGDLPCGEADREAICSEDGTWQVTTSSLSCNPPQPICPAEPPADQSACAPAELYAFCMYEDPFCGGASSIQASCDTGIWSVVQYPCNPPPPCPLDLPAPGSVCAPFEDPVWACEYDNPACPGVPIEATCIGGSWVLATPVICPPLQVFCGYYADPTSCDSDPACQWLVPGCAQPPGQIALPSAGCFSAGDCTFTGCMVPGEVCQKVVVDPCGSCLACLCATCNNEIAVCLSLPGG